jgi:hypothetical protein
MIKFTKSAVAIALSISIIAGGSPLAQTKAYASEIITATPIKAITVNKLQFEVVKNIESIIKIEDVLNELKTQKGFIVFDNKIMGIDSTDYYIAVLSGQKPSGGFGIEVKSVEDNEGITSIVVEEIEPAPGAFVTQVITYPYVLIKVKTRVPTFSVKNSKSEVFTHFNSSAYGIPQTDKRVVVQPPAPVKSIKYTSANGAFRGWFNKDFISIKINNSFRKFKLTNATRNYLIKYNLKKNTKIKIQYYTDDKGQLIVTKISK